MRQYKLFLQLLLVFIIALIGAGSILDHDGRLAWRDNGNKKQTFDESLSLKIMKDKSIGLPGEWKRESLIAAGQLSSGMPRITLHDAERLWKKYEQSQHRTSDLETAFNLIAGAPDWEGGSGIHRSIYFLNDELTEAVYVMFDNVYYVAVNDKGKQIVKQVGQS